MKNYLTVHLPESIRKFVDPLFQKNECSTLRSPKICTVSAANALLKAPNEALQNLEDADLISALAALGLAAPEKKPVDSVDRLGSRARIRFFWAFACFS